MRRLGLRQLVVAICAASILAACGGGSQSSSPSSLVIQATTVPSTAPAGQPYSAQVKASAPSGTTIGYDIKNKPRWISFSTATGSLRGTPTLADLGSYQDIIVSASDGTHTVSLPPFSIAVTATTGASGSAARPSYNKGSGFFVLKGKLYDPNGQEFRIRGVNRVHWDSNSASGIALSGANTVRWNMDFSRDASANVSEIEVQGVDNRNVPIVGNWSTTCKSDPNLLAAAVQKWVSQAAQWKQLDKYLILNIANEWGPANSTVWRDSYTKAIAQLRGAGYTGPILIDSGNCGQDDQDLLRYSQAVFNSDAERNVMFAVHLYNSANDYSASILSVHKGNPTVITLGSSSATHPFAPRYTGSNNNWSGINAYQIDGVRGMTPLNGKQSASASVGGVPGAWTITLSVDSTNWPDYTGGGTVIDYDGNYALRIARLAALGQSTGAAYVIGEFGPGKNIGPSPTMVSPADIISAAEASGIGWLAWAWDDVNLSDCKADNTWFSMTYHCGAYGQPSDLTAFGQDVVLNPSYGISRLAKPASIF